MKQPCVYVLASKRNVTLYVGVPSNLIEETNPNWHDLYEDLI